MSAERLILWRHGRTAYNHTGRFQGQLDVELDETGIEQARVAAERLADYEPSAIISSDLKRARFTAQALADRMGLSVQHTQKLREIDVGRWEGMARNDVIAQWPDEFEAWRRGDDVVVGGGECRSQVTARMIEAIRDAIAIHEGTVIVVSHGAALRGVTIELLGLPNEMLPSFAGMGNARWHVLSARSENLFRLVEYNVSASTQMQPEESWAQSASPSTRRQMPSDAGIVA